MVKGRLNINYYERELPVRPLPFDTRNVVALISEFEEIVNPVKKMLQIISEAIDVANASTDSTVQSDVLAVPKLPAKIADKITNLINPTIVDVIQVIEDTKAEVLNDVANDPVTVENADFKYMKFRSLGEAVKELNYTVDENNNIIYSGISPSAMGNTLLDKMYSVRPGMKTILLINKNEVPKLEDQLNIISKSSTSIIVKDKAWTSDELDIYAIFAQEQKANMQGSGLVGSLNLASDEFNNMVKAKTNYMDKFDFGGILFMATSPLNAEGDMYTMSETLVNGVRNVEFDLDEVGAFWAAYISGMTENQSLSRQIVDIINADTLSTEEYYAENNLNGAEDICLQTGLIAINQRDIITEQFEVLNSNTPKYYKRLNDYLDMSIVRTQNLIKNEVREGLRRLQGNKNKPVAYSAAKSLIDFLKAIYTPDYVDNLVVTAAKNGSAKVIATVESDYTNIIGTIDVYGFNNVE